MHIHSKIMMFTKIIKILIIHKLIIEINKEKKYHLQFH